MQSYSPSVATAVTITFNYDLVAFIPMLGVGAAVTSLAAQRMGAGDVRGARRATYLGLRVAWSYAGIMVVAFVVGAPVLVRVFSSGFGAGDEEILPLAQKLLRLAALYTLADATQVVFSGALRGAGDTKWVMIIAVTLHWVMAIGAFILIRILVVPPVGGLAVLHRIRGLHGICHVSSAPSRGVAEHQGHGKRASGSGGLRHRCRQGTCGAASSRRLRT